MSKQVTIFSYQILKLYFFKGLKIDLKLPFDRKVDLPKKESSILSKKTDNEETKKDFSSSTEDSKSTTTFEGLETLESLISSELAESSGMALL